MRNARRLEKQYGRARSENRARRSPPRPRIVTVYTALDAPRRVLDEIRDLAGSLGGAEEPSIRSDDEIVRPFVFPSIDSATSFAMRLDRTEEISFLVGPPS